MAGPSAEYVISIAAALDSPDLGAAELAGLESALTGAGKRSDDYQAALRRLESELDVARAASVAANAALAEGSDRYAQLERAALQTAKAVERAQARGRFDPRAARDADSARAALAAYEGELKALEGAASGAAAGQKKLEGSIAHVTKAAKGADAANAKANQRYEKLSQAAGLLPGPLRSIAQKGIQAARAQTGLTAALGGSSAQLILAAGAVVGLTVVVVALTAAAVAGYLAFGKYAIGAADTARSAGLAREAFAALDETTKAATGAFSAIADETGQSDAALMGLTKSLRAANVSAADMPRALRAAAMAETALGKGGSAEFIKRLEDGSQTVDQFASDVSSKFGGIVAKQILGLDSLSEKFSRNWSRIFEGVDIEPVLRALNILVSAFDAGAPLAEFFGMAIRGALSPIVGNAESAAFAIEAFALKVAIAMTKAYIFAKENSTAIAIALGVMFSPLILAAALFLGIPALLGTALVALLGFSDRVTEIGVNLMKGLAAGITGGVSYVVTAIAGAIGTAIDTAKAVLGIASPSKVFAEIGGHTAAGFSEGVDAGAGGAADSLSSMVDPGPSEATAAASSKGGGSSIDLSGATFVFHGVADADTAASKLGAMLTRLLEGDADSLTGAEVPA